MKNDVENEDLNLNLKLAYLPMFFSKILFGSDFFSLIFYTFINESKKEIKSSENVALAYGFLLYGFCLLAFDFLTKIILLFGFRLFSHP